MSLKPVSRSVRAARLSNTNAAHEAGRRLWRTMATLTAMAALMALAAGSLHAQTPEPSTPPASAPAPGPNPNINHQPEPARLAKVGTGPSIFSPTKYAPADLARAFNYLDKNRDGSISRSEAAALKNVSKHFDVADTNSDQHLSRQEFDRALNTTRPE